MLQEQPEGFVRDAVRSCGFVLLPRGCGELEVFRGAGSPRRPLAEVGKGVSGVIQTPCCSSGGGP